MFCQEHSNHKPVISHLNGLNKSHQKISVALLFPKFKMGNSHSFKKTQVLRGWTKQDALKRRSRSSRDTCRSLFHKAGYSVTALEFPAFLICLFILYSTVESQMASCHKNQNNQKLSTLKMQQRKSKTVLGHQKESRIRGHKIPAY